MQIGCGLLSKLHRNNHHVSNGHADIKSMPLLINSQNHRNVNSNLNEIHLILVQRAIIKRMNSKFGEGEEKMEPRHSGCGNAN